MRTTLESVKSILFLSFILLVYGTSWAEESAYTEEDVQEQSVDIEQDDIQVPPRGQKGMVEIMTSPEKAMVYLGGEELGHSPIDKREFPSGRYDLTIMLGGEELVKERVNIWPNQTLSIKKKLIIPYGTIILTTQPGHTKVFLDGEEVGVTTGGPLTINNVSAGSHIVKVTAPKHRAREVEISISGEDTAKVDIRL